MARRRLSTPTPGTADRLVKTLSPRLPVCIACAEFYTAVDDRWKLRADRECGQRRAAEVGRSVEDFLCLRPSPARRRGTARIRTAREAAVDRQILRNRHLIRHGADHLDRAKHIPSNTAWHICCRVVQVKSVGLAVGSAIDSRKLFSEAATAAAAPFTDTRPRLCSHEAARLRSPIRSAEPAALPAHR